MRTFNSDDIQFKNSILFPQLISLSNRPSKLFKISVNDCNIINIELIPGSRSMLKNCVVDIKEDCKYQNVPFFFKQWGGVNKKKAGRVLQGRTWDEMPEFKQAV
ncbi:MAG: DUF5131 family protein [Melioribacteraceae bacterium]|nr:MAG: DUF5131 family protein [Melioribacteraceae bacterium]